MKHSFSLIVAALAGAGLLSACGGGDAEPTGPQSVEIAFAAVAGSTPVTCATTEITDLGTTNAKGRLRDLRFYVSNAKLIRADGTEVALTLPANDNWNATVGSDAVTLIDLEDRTGACQGTADTNTTLKGTVPAGDYVGVTMTLGVPLALNHTDQGAGVDVTPNVINNGVHPGMAWAWASGRKFTKIELTDVLAAAAAGTAGQWKDAVFNVHLGSTNCTGTNPAAGLVSQCTEPNRATLRFAAFKPATQKINVDVRALLAENDATVNLSGPTGCMSGLTDPECTGVFKALQIGFNGAAAAGAAFTIGKVGDASNYGLPVNGGAAQTVFKVAAK
jgi:uncharacterized repeat protein (TIGR04052 family)